jgi:SAM-dependent methyltransferase
MPTSEHHQIPYVVDAMVREQPASVLDVGCGYGKYGVLAREYTAATRVDAIDVAPPRYPVYDHFYPGDLRALGTVLPADAPRYDLALLLDVIEHFEKAEGWAVVDQLCARARRVLITTPWGFRRQEIPGLPFETHRSGWYPWEFGGRCRVHRTQVFPGHYTKHLRLPRLWQLLVVVGRKGG